MNNKDEKTFADLFSSSTSEKEVEEQTFSNIFKSENQDNEKITEKKETETIENNNPITFDNIVDSISNQEPTMPKDETNIFKEAIKEQNEDVKSESSVFEQSSIEEPEIQTKNTEEESKESFENIFKTISPDEPIFSETKPSQPENNNPFFMDDGPSNSEESSIDNPFFQDNSLDDDKTPEIKEEKENDITNPFFNETDNSIEFEEEKAKVSETEPLINELDEKNIETNANPFFNNSDENQPPIIDLKLKEATPETTNELEEINPFFENKDSKIEEEKIEEKKPTEVKSEPDTPKSSSPFFEEEKKEDTTNNPFFQGQLNLVENKEHSKPIGNIDISKSKHFDVKIVKKKEPLIKFIIGVFSYAIFIFLLLIGITLLVYVLDTKIRAAKGDYSTPTFNAYVVLTGSMLPEIEVNDVVITKKVDAADLKERDIITFASADSRFQGTIITHRIVKKNPPDGTNGYTFQTRGDNNNVVDSALVPEANIYGKVILKIPKLGYLQEFLASDGGWIIVILIPCLTVISYDIVKLIKGLKRKKYKNIKVQK